MGLGFIVLTHGCVDRGVDADSDLDFRQIHGSPHVLG
jgi:hypothetical protein